MRLLGTFTNQTEAITALGLLTSRQIGCRLEAMANAWELWALNEDQLLEARTLYQQYVDDPLKEQYVAHLEAALKILHADKAKKEQAARRQALNSAVAVLPPAVRSTPLTWIIIAICCGLWALQTVLPPVFPYLCMLFQIAPLGDNSLSAIFDRWQFWRLFTPALLHFPIIAPNGQFNLMGILHIGFNMLWIKDLAPLIERKHGTLYLAFLFLLIGIFSNLTQFFLAGPNFLGMSGVVYGLLGFLWIRGKIDPRYSVEINTGVVYFMLVWLVFCIFLASAVANGSHIGGLLIGAAWGALSGTWAKNQK